KSLLCDMLGVEPKAILKEDIQQKAHMATEGAEIDLYKHMQDVQNHISLGNVAEATNMVEGLRHKMSRTPSHTLAHQIVLDMELDWLREKVLSLHKQNYINIKKSALAQLQEKKPTFHDLPPNKKFY